MRDTLNLLICALYNLTILLVTVYLIVYHDWSKWWILGAVTFFASPKNAFKNKCD